MQRFKPDRKQSRCIVSAGFLHARVRPVVGSISVASIGTKFKGLLAVVAFGATLAIAAPASALQLLYASMDTSNVANISGGIYGAGGINVYDAPVTFIATNGGGPQFSFTAFCIDLIHDMTLGTLNGGAGYAYHEEPLVYDSLGSTFTQQGGNLLTTTQLDKIGALVNYGEVLRTSNAIDLSHKLAAVQAAIWVVEFGPAYTVTVNAAVATYLPTYINDAAVASYMPAGPITTIFANNFQNQAFAIAASVPEPTTWLMMILGFGGIGAVLRRRRQNTAFA